jgi:beta-lactamase regulating signal transducer with metallopeptidase domain
MNLIDLAIKSVILASMGLLAAACMKKNSAAARHLVLKLTLLSLCGLPLLATYGPSWSVPFIKVGAPKVARVPKISVKPVFGPVMESTSVTGRSGHVLAYGSGVSKIGDFSSRQILFAIWAAGAVSLLLLRLARLLRLRKLETSLQMSNDRNLNGAVAEYCRRLNRHVLLLEGETGQPPMTWGHGRPVLLLPADAGHWPEAHLRSVVFHELAHIERSDWLVSVFAQFISAVFWMNPLVHVILYKMEAESEIAADDRVLMEGVSGPQYASHLIALVRQLSAAKSFDRPALAMARNARLDGRIFAILESRRCRRSAKGFLAIGWGAAVALAVLIVGSATPTLIKAETGAQVLGQSARFAMTCDPEIASPRVEIVAKAETPLAPVPPQQEAKTVRTAPIAVHRHEKHRSTVQLPAHRASVQLASKDSRDFNRNLEVASEQFEQAFEKASFADVLTKAHSDGPLHGKEISHVDQDLQNAALKIGKAAKADTSTEIRDAFRKARIEMRKAHVKIDFSALAKMAIQAADTALKEGDSHLPKGKAELDD